MRSFQLSGCELLSYNNPLFNEYATASAKSRRNIGVRANKSGRVFCMGVNAPFGGAYSALAQLGEASRPLAVGGIDSTGLGPPPRPPTQPRSQCRGFFFAAVAMAKEAAILSTSRSVAAYWRWSGKEGASSTPSRRSILATATRQSSPSQTAAAANTIEPLASLI